MIRADPNLIRSEVAILGAGVAGSALASALAARHQTILIERAFCPNRHHIGESLPPAALRSLASLGLTDVAQKAACLPYHGITSIWGQEAAVRYDFLQAPEGFGLHLDRRAFDAHLLQMAMAQGAALVYANQIGEIVRSGRNWSIPLSSLNGDRVVQSQILVDATGRKAVLARKIKVRRQILDCLVAQYAVLPEAPQLAKENLGVTLLESTSEGWWYAAPIPEGRQVVAFHSDSDLTALKRLRQPGAWFNALRQTQLIATSVDLDITESFALKPSITAANSAHLLETAGENWLAIGDAAISFDPISSQGLFNALTTALLARDAIDGYFAGQLDAMQRYATQMREVVKAYQKNLARHYCYERRWSEWEFWQRRHNLDVAELRDESDG